VPDYNPQKYKVSPGLSELITLKLATKPIIVMEVWNYIKVSKLEKKTCLSVTKSTISNINYKMNRTRES
jgi:SWI/SNF-related matrix-associated actin-dependent regulator of chromatin subfamily D